MEVFSSLLGTCLTGFTRKSHWLVGSYGMINIWQTAEILHQLEMKPSTEEEQLTLDGILLLLGGSGHQVHILQTQICLTDAIPCSLPETTLETAFRSKRIKRITLVHEACVPSVELILPAPEVTLVNLVVHHIVDTHSWDIILTPVPGRVPVTLGEVRNTEIKLLCKALEILEILESSLCRYIRFR